jgi:hypothetical protein
MDNNWTHIKEQKINEIKCACDLYVIAHDDQRKKYNLLLNILTIQSIIISTTSTLLSSLASYQKTQNFWIIITIGIVSAISTALGLIIAYITPAKKLSNHIESRNKYRVIIAKIKEQLFYDYKNRKNCDNFMNEICSEMLELETNEENIPIIDKNTLLKEKNKETNNIEIKENITGANISIKLKDIENGNIKSEETNDNYFIINGLTPEQNMDFNLLFKRLPSVNSNFTKFQMERFNNE